MLPKNKKEKKTNKKWSVLEKQVFQKLLSKKPSVLNRVQRVHGKQFLFRKQSIFWKWLKTLFMKH